jgi:hypothetical protein
VFFAADSGSYDQGSFQLVADFLEDPHKPDVYIRPATTIATRKLAPTKVFRNIAHPLSFLLSPHP